MNLSRQSWSCPIIEERIPNNADDLISELCKMYYNGEITDDDKYKDAQHIDKILFG